MAANGLPQVFIRGKKAKTGFVADHFTLLILRLFLCQSKGNGMTPKYWDELCLFCGFPIVDCRCPGGIHTEQHGFPLLDVRPRFAAPLIAGQRVFYNTL